MEASVVQRGWLPCHLQSTIVPSAMPWLTLSSDRLTSSAPEQGREESRQRTNAALLLQSREKLDGTLPRNQLSRTKLVL